MYEWLSLKDYSAKLAFGSHWVNIQINNLNENSINFSQWGQLYYIYKYYIYKLPIYLKMDIIQDHYNDVTLQISNTESKINELTETIKELELTQKIQVDIINQQRQQINCVESKCQLLEKLLQPTSKMHTDLDGLDKKIVQQQNVLKDHYRFYKIFMNMNQVKPK